MTRRLWVVGMMGGGGSRDPGMNVSEYIPRGMIGTKDFVRWEN